MATKLLISKYVLKYFLEKSSPRTLRASAFIQTIILNSQKNSEG